MAGQRDDPRELGIMIRPHGDNPITVSEAAAHPPRQGTMRNTTGTHPDVPACSARYTQHMADVRRVWADRIRTEREARGGDKPEMARRLAHAAGEARSGLPHHDSLLSYVKRWERGQNPPPTG
jgi:hypothetical protein